jgi:hypothetical protein
LSILYSLLKRKYRHELFSFDMKATDPESRAIALMHDLQHHGLQSPASTPDAFLIVRLLQ